MNQYNFTELPSFLEINGRFDASCVVSLSADIEDSVRNGSANIRIQQHGNQDDIISGVNLKLHDFRGQLFISIGCNNANVIFEKGCNGYFDVRLWRNSTLIVGEQTSSNGVRIVCDYSTVLIGKDCMFSDETLIQSADQHGIVDIKSGEIINNKIRKTVIGEHVWLGRRCIVMADVDIGTGAIVGAGAIVTKSIPPVSICAGIPAKVVRTDVSWSRSPTTLDWYAADLVKNNI